MYINDVHILWYVFMGGVGLLLSYLITWMNKRLPEYKKVFCKEIFSEPRPKTSYVLMGIMVAIYLGLTYQFGISRELIDNIDLIQYAILIPMLVSAFMIDYKLQIIPNRLTLTMFEIGLVFTFIYGMISINMAGTLFLGAIAGGGIFLIITLLGGFIAGKEAMGLGDVKLMGALGLFFGLTKIVAISVLAFLIGAILSIILLVTKVKKKNEYIPFGPFIVLATFVTIFVPFNLLLNSLITVLTLGLNLR